MLTLHTFGDSILDCGRFNRFGLTPGALLVHNDDGQFPEFIGHDLSSRVPSQVIHHARSGSTVHHLQGQADGLQATSPSLALLTIGGNDLIDGLVTDAGPGIAAFSRDLALFLRRLSIRPVLIGNVYDPTFGSDRWWDLLGVDPLLARSNLTRINASLAEAAASVGKLVDLHRHFLDGDPSWLTFDIEPSLRGASEIRRRFLPYVLEVI